MQSSVTHLIEGAHGVDECSAKLAKNWVKHLGRITRKSSTKLPANLERQFCPACHSLFGDSNLRVRVTKGVPTKVAYVCLACMRRRTYRVSPKGPPKVQAPQVQPAPKASKGGRKPKIELVNGLRRLLYIFLVRYVLCLLCRKLNSW